MEYSAEQINVFNKYSQGKIYLSQDQEAPVKQH